MLAVHLDDVFSSFWATHNKPAIVGLKEHITASCSLDIIDNISYGPPLPETQTGMFASRDAWLSLISTIVGLRSLGLRHEQSSSTKLLASYPCLPTP